VTSTRATGHGRFQSTLSLLTAAVAGAALLLVSPVAMAGTASGKGGSLTSGRTIRPPIRVATPRTVSRYVPTFLRAPSLAPSPYRPAPITPASPTAPEQPQEPEPELVEPTGTGFVDVLATCSGAPCVGGATVEIRVAGDVVATGRSGQSLEVPAGTPFDA